MNDIVPNRFLIRPELSLPWFKKPPPLDGSVAEWPDAARLPALCELDGMRPFAEVFAGWNRDGLYFGIRVRGKPARPRHDAGEDGRADGVCILTDMRDTRTINRASRYCQMFLLSPGDGGKSKRSAWGQSEKIERAMEDAPVARPEQIVVAAKPVRDGYDMTAHLTAEALHGFDPEEHPRIGLFIVVEDESLGQQSLTVDDEMDWHVDPSLWPTAVLTR